MSGATSKRGWLTRDTVPTLNGKTITLPGDPAWQGDFFGAVWLLTFEYNWKPYGDLTAEQMADAWRDFVLEWMDP